MVDHRPSTERDSRDLELFLRVARNPRICCGCACLSPEDRHRARRVFRLTQVVARDWEKERRAAHP